MPVLKNFSENGEFLGTKQESLNAENLSNYISEHGTQRLQGYSDALTDIQKHLGEILFYEWEDGKSKLNPPIDVRKELKDFFLEQKELSILISQLLPLLDKKDSYLNPDTKVTP